MTGSSFQLYNGIVLLITFFGARVAWGIYQSIRIYRDVWLILHGSILGWKGWSSFGSVLPSRDQSEVMRFAGKEGLPPWLTFVYLGSNTLLTLLNVYWFWMMIASVRKRFAPASRGKAKMARE